MLHKLPHIGLRIIKSSTAVFVCLALGYFRGDGLPFYSAIAAILCIQSDVKSSFKVGLNRTIGTLIGGTFGLVILFILRTFFPTGHPLWQYFLISLSLIPLIYITVLMEKQSASYISCVVFLSIVISHGDDLVPYVFAVNRIIDTLIGIFVALGINSIPGLEKKVENIVEDIVDK